MVADAQQYLGVPYLWGGTDPSKGLDCSGLTQRVYADMGISLPRTAAAAGHGGQPVASLADAQPGDLVFFDYSSPGRHRPRRHLRRQRPDDRRPAGGRVGQVQPVGNPTLIRRVLPDAARPRPPPSGAAALAGVPYADLFTAGRRPSTASRRRCWRPWPRRSPASTPPRSPPPGARASCSSCPPRRRAWASTRSTRRRPSTAPPATSPACRPVRLHRPRAGRLQRRPGRGQPLRRHPARTPRPRTTSAP